MVQNEMTDVVAADQLAALGRVASTLEDAGIAYWLFGGWAVDLYVGSVTRAHDDIDMLVWLDDLPRISELLRADGWRHAPRQDDDGGTGYERGAVRLELTYLVRAGDGTIYTPLSEGRVEWPEEALGSDYRELQEVRARLIGLGPLTSGKSWARDDPDDAAKDRADHARLSLLDGPHGRSGGAGRI